MATTAALARSRALARVDTGVSRHHQTFEDAKAVQRTGPSVWQRSTRSRISAQHCTPSHHQSLQNVHLGGGLRGAVSHISDLTPGQLQSSVEWGRHGKSVTRTGSRRYVVVCQAESGNEAEGAGVGEGAQKVEFVFDPKKKMDDFASKFDPDQRRRTSSLNLFSPSKVNVFLRVTGKRPDGYHDLASLFHVIDLGDRLKFTLGPGKKDSLTSNSRLVPLGEKNLVIKALNVFRQKTGVQQFFWIHLDKKVPTGAGLGGGSGNAATALWAANELSGRPATNAQLLEWSAEVGSDVPVFFSRGAAYCTGRGEIVEDIHPGPIPLDTPMVLIKPKASCKTPEVFKKFSLDRASTTDPRQLLADITKTGIRQEYCINDLEEPAFEVLPSLKKLKDRIAQGGRGRYSAVFMSGSGSTIVGVGDPEPPQFIYDEDRYQDVFVEAAYFLTREEDEWYRPSRLIEPGFGAAESRSDLQVEVPTEGQLGTSFFERPESSRIQF